MHKLLVYILAFLAIGGLFWTPETLSEGFFSFSNRGNIGVYVDCGGQDCLRAGVQDAGVALGQTGIETEKSIVQAVQDLVKAFLSYLSLIAVIYIIGAGAYLIFGSANDETISKVRKIILYVILGIVIIWIAYWIVAVVIGTLSGRTFTSIRTPHAYAQTQIRSVDFESYANKIRGMRTAIRGTYDPDIMEELETLIDGAYQHLPDGDEFFNNKNLYEGVKQRIAEYNASKQSLARGALQIALDDFFDEIYAPKISGNIVASPSEGSAPLSVTFDARDMRDESGHVLTENNYIWWMKDTNLGPQVIGRGKTINHTFQTQGNYTVFLTVNSDSKNGKGFTDVISFEDSTSIQVNQEDIRFYILFNDQLISLEDTVKIPTKEAAAGIVIDASGTFIPDGYKIVASEWNFGNGQKSPVEGAPKIEYLTYEEGSYNLTLTIERNDGKELTKRIRLVVGDPIANIRASKTLIHRGETVHFKANKLSSDNTNYSWEIREVGNPIPIHVDQGAILSYPFMKIGRYQVMLISEKFDGSRDQDTTNITVASQPPVAHFSYRSVSSHLPNTLIFDATRSYDPDLEDESTLTYSWFIDGTPVSLENPERNNSRGTYTFNERGSYNITLSIRDAEGKITSTTKEIDIESTLFIMLDSDPLVAKRGETINFTATSSKDAKSFSWNFGDKQVNTTTDGKASHVYRLAGAYDVSVTVQDNFGQENNLKKKIYVVDADEPLAIIDSNSGSIFSQVQDNACSGENALVTDRLNGIFLSGERSVNSSGRGENLTYFWKIGLNETSAQKRFEYIFDEIGCHEVQLTVTDTNNGKSHTASQYVQVKNLAPEFSDMTINIDNVDMDPMTIRLSLGGAEDPDGVIRSYTWYYFTDFDANPQGFRVTTTPETVFVLPKITGRYKFAVVLEDSNGLKIDSTELNRGEFTTPDLFVNQNLSTPIIRFDVGKPELLLGEESVFTVSVKNALGQEIADRSEFRWDFDGDGFYDLKTEKNTTTYKYTLPGEYNPKVKVTHRGISSSKHGTVRVENLLEPSIQAYVIGNTIVAHNTTTGVYKGVKWKYNNKIISDNQDYVIFTPEDFPVTLGLDVSDGKQEQNTSITLEKNFKNKAKILQENQDLIVMVNTSNNPEEPLINPDDITLEDPSEYVFVYLGESTERAHRFHIDVDTELDSDLNGEPADDIDNRSSGSYTTGRPFRIPLDKKHKQIVQISIIDTEEQVIAKHELEITQNFIEAPIFNGPIDVVEIDLTDQDKLRVNRLNQLIQNAPEELQFQLGKYVELLLDEWYDTTARADTLFRMHQYINENGQSAPELAEEIQKQIDAIYAQGQSDLTDKELAQKLIEDFIPKTHPEYVRIFGNPQTGEPGWIEQFVDDPAYAMDNYAFAEKIWKSIDFNTEITDEKKQVIYDKLGVLIGQPLDQAPGIDTEKPTDVKNGEDGGSKRGSIWKWILLILSGFIFVTIAIFGIRFVLQKVRQEGSKKDPFATLETPETTPTDTTTENEPSNISNDTPDWLQEPSNNTPAQPEEVTTSESTPDWLKAEETSTSQETAIQEASTETDTPDWLQTAQEVPGQETGDTSPQDMQTPDWLASSDTSAGSKNAPMETSSTPTTEDTPDWLKAEEMTPSEIPKMEQTEETTENTDTPDWLQSAPVQTEESAPGETASEDAPDWLKTTDANDTQESTPLATAETEDAPDWLKAEEMTPSEIPKMEQTEEVQETTENTDTPDWLESAQEIPEQQVGDTSPQDTQTPDWLDIEAKVQDIPNATPETTQNDETNKPPYQSKDGTDLTKIPNIYAIIPHEDGDHKLVFFEEDAPAGLLENPKKGKKGSAYKKGKMKIYDIHVDMKLHPELRQKKGQPMDVWLINSKEDMDQQIKAIKSGKGGGKKFQEPHIVTHDENTPSTEPKTQKSDRSALISKDGTDLTKIPNTYAIVQHQDGDHKLVYMRDKAPDNLRDDPQNRTKGGTYAKGKMKIYNVHVDMKEHPTLKSKDNDHTDVWIIDTPEDLQRQYKAIKNGKGGGTKFMDIHYLDKEDRNKDILPKMSSSEEQVIFEQISNQTANFEAQKENTSPSNADARQQENIPTPSETKLPEPEMMNDPFATTSENIIDSTELKDPQTIVAPTTEPQATPEPQIETTPNTDAPKESMSAPETNTQDNDDLPDWLKGDIDASATTQFTDDLKKMEEDRQKEIDAMRQEQQDGENNIPPIPNS